MSVVLSLSLQAWIERGMGIGWSIGGGAADNDCGGGGAAN